MENQRPLILVSNDDGIIVVMAPDAPRSGSACALTVTEPIRYQLLRKDVGLTVYKCSGTPTDCVKLAFHTVLDRKPDLVVGGINHGDNSSVNVHYSGTMGVVIEGCLKGVPSIGFSLCNHDQDADFEPAGTYIHRGDAHYYWLTGEFEDAETGNEKSDHWALENGYVAITPTTVDVTAYGLIDELKTWF